MTLGVETLVVAISAGAAFGALYLSILLLGTRSLAGPRPVQGFVALSVLRAALVLGALAALAALGASATAFLGALAGFVAARVAATGMARTYSGKLRIWR